VSFIKIRVLKIKTSLFFSIFMVSAFCFAQDRLINGAVANEKEVEGIHVLNTSSRYNSITDENGNFSIRAVKNDTLVFSSVKYFPKKIVVSEEIFEEGTLSVTLKELINELDEVILGHNLSGNIDADLKNIKTEKPLDFDDVGIPGFKGKPEEKIVPVAVAFFPTNVNIEAVYKYLSGYYRKLRLQRKWEAQNNSVAMIIDFYTPAFFKEAYAIPENRLYDFILFCIETSSLQNDFKRENYFMVLEIFKDKGKIYRSRLPTEDE